MPFERLGESRWNRAASGFLRLTSVFEKHAGLQCTRA